MLVAESRVPKLESPGGPRRLLRIVVVLGLSSSVLGVPAVAQTPPDTTTARPPRALVDSLRPPISPGRAFLSSLLLPGLGQSRLQRHMAGTLYFAVEAVSIAMLIKSSNDLRVARAGEAYEVINRYQVDQNGAPVIQNGAFVPLDTARSRYNAERVRARRTHVEDWIAILVANHLFAGADAFVAALLWDLPARIGASATRNGVGFGLSVRW